MRSQRMIQAPRLAKPTGRVIKGDDGLLVIFCLFFSLQTKWFSHGMIINSLLNGYGNVDDPPSYPTVMSPPMP